MWLEFRRVLFRSLLTAGALILAVNLNVLLAPAKLAPGGVRSEERRVGKECRIGCRSRWSPDQQQKNKLQRLQRHRLRLEVAEGGHEHGDQQGYDPPLPLFFFFKQKTAYEISECDWSSDVCSSD